MRRVTRRRGACQSCRSRKVRCDGADPCLNCERSRHTCYYPPLAPRQRKNTAGGTGTNSPATHHMRRLNVDTHRIAPSYGTWRQFSGEDSISTPTSSGDDRNDGVELESLEDDFSCMQQFSLPNSYPGSQYGDGLGLLDVPIPGEDELLELLDSSPSECNSSGEFSFDFTNLQSDKHIPSPTPEQRVTSNNHWEQRQHSISPPDYNTLFNFNELTEAPWRGLDMAEKSTNENEVTVTVDFSASNLYGLLSCIARSSQESHKTETIKIVNDLRRVLCANSSTTGIKEMLDENGHFPDSEAAVSQYCDSCFEDCCPVANFLTRSAIDRIIKESREPDADILVTVFVNAIVAIGYHTTCLRGQEVLGVDEMRDSRLRLSSVLGLHTKIQTLPSSLVKLQATLLMVVIARMCDESLVWDKIIAAVSCARELRLVHTARIQQPSLNAEDQELAQRSIWFLYSLETDYAIHHGMFPMLDLEWETRFPSFGRGDDMTAVSYTYSELLHSVLKFQYSPRALAKSSSAYDLKDRLQASCHALNEWISRLPAPLNEACDAKNLQDIKDDRQLREAFRVFCMYHRAIFFIHCPWISATSPDGMKSFRVAELTREKCAERCIESAFAVVKLANCGLFWEKGLDRDLSSSGQWGDMGQLLLVSLCFIVHYLVNGDQCNRSTAMPYLAICGGLFGRLSLESDEGSLLDHYLELVQIVRAT